MCQCESDRSVAPGPREKPFGASLIFSAFSPEPSLLVMAQFDYSLSPSLPNKLSAMCGAKETSDHRPPRKNTVFINYHFTN